MAINITKPAVGQENQGGILDTVLTELAKAPYTATSTINAIVKFADTAGNLANTGITIDSSNKVSGATALFINGIDDGSGAKLQVKGNIKMVGTISQCTLESTQANGDAEYIAKSTVAQWGMGTNISLTDGSFEIYDRKNSMQRFSISPTGNTKINILAGIGNRPILVDSTGEIIVSNIVNTFIPVVSSTIGSIGSYTSSCKYVNLGNKVSVTIYINIASIGSAGGNIKCTLPFQSIENACFSGNEVAATGSSLACVNVSGTSYFFISKYDNTFIGGNNYKFVISGEYFI